MSKYSQQFKVPELKQTLIHRSKQEKNNRLLRRQNAFDGSRIMSPQAAQQPEKTKLELRMERLKIWREKKEQKIEEEKKNKKPDWKCIKHRFDTFGEKNKDTKNLSKGSTSSQQSSRQQSKRSCLSLKSVPGNIVIQHVPTKSPLKRSTLKHKSSRQQPKRSCQSLKSVPSTNIVAQNQPNQALNVPQIKIQHVPTPSTPSTSNYQFGAPWLHDAKKKGAAEILDISYQRFSNIENDRNISITSTPTLAATTRTDMGVFVVTPVKMRPKCGTNKSSRPPGGEEFEELLEMEIERLTTRCKDWETILSDITDIPSHIQDEIEATIGQTKLLITKKFEQFRKLTYGIGPKKIEPDDLQGFWDMMNIQVNGLDTRFYNLSKLKTNSWIEEVPVVAKKSTKIKKANAVKAVGASAGLKAAIAAAKKKMAEETKENENPETEIQSKLERTKNFPESPKEEEKSSKNKTRQTRPRRTNVFANMLRAKKENRIGGCSGNSLNASSPKSDGENVSCGRITRSSSK